MSGIQDFRFSDLLPRNMRPEDLIPLLAGLAMLAVCFAVWNALRVSRSYERRFAQVVQRRDSLRQDAIATRSSRQRLTAAGFMSEAVKRLNLMRSKHATDARALLAQAGMRGRDATVRYLFARISMPFIAAFAVVSDSYALHLLPIPPAFEMAAAMMAGVFGFFAPGMYIKNLVAKRARRLQLGLPDALDLMVICAEAGLSLDATLLRVARELEPTAPDLAEEFGITSAELTFLPERRMAFENLNSRTNLSSIRGVVNTLLQTAKFGTPLAQSLRVLSAEFRDARIIRAEEKAARLPALMTVPMILFILPTLFIVLLGPAALNVIDTFSRR